MRLTLSLIALVGLTACGGSSSTDRSNSTTVAPSASVAKEACDRNSWVAGIVEYCRGSLIYRDYVYDDYGADSGLISADPALLNLIGRAGQLGSPLANTPGLLSPTAGDKRYPAGLENTADLVKLTLTIEGDDLVADFELNTLFNADDALAAIAIDTDNNASTGGGSWAPLKTASKGWDVLEVFANGNPDSNHIIGRLPLPAGDTWRVQAAVAQKDGTVMNVAFRGIDEEAKAGKLPDQILPGSGNFWEDRQAAVLGSGDISVFGEFVQVADLRNGVSRIAPKVTGFHQRVYTSQYTLGEGVAMMGIPGRHGDTKLPCEQYFNYLGKYQPYGIYLPEGMNSGESITPGVQLVMHGCQANHASQINGPNMQKQFGDDLSRILVSPLGRGPFGFYSGISERDVLDVLADVEATYATDKERVFAGGYSMGGYGAMRLAALYPDRFAGLVSWVGFGGHVGNLPLPINPLPDLLAQLGQSLKLPLISDALRIGAAENIIDFLGNLHNVPGAYVYGALDELVQVTTSLALQQRLEAVGVPYQFYLHPIAEHLTFVLLDSWQKEANYTRDLVRVKNPTRVKYRTDLAFDFPEYKITHDKAYWVSGITARGDGNSDIDLAAPGCGGSDWTFSSEQNIGLVPLPWVGWLRRITGDEPVLATATIMGSLSNVSALQIDAAATCLKGKLVRYDIDSDGPVQLRLSDGRSLSLPVGGGQGSF